MMMTSKRKIVTWVVCRLALLEVRGTSRSGYSNCKHCQDDGDDHDHYGDDYGDDDDVDDDDDKCLNEK